MSHRYPALRSMLVALASLLATAAGRPAGAQAPTGIIAFIRDGKEIRVIAPDGTGERRLWAHPRPDLQTFGITGVAWRPDGKELAFTSGHEAVTSFLESDVFGIRPDGTGLRRITNPPAQAELARLPKGKVVVTVSAARAGAYVIYVVGATKPETAIVGSSSPATVTFDDVADLGIGLQPVVAMLGESRWVIAGVDVRAGSTVRAPALTISGKGHTRFGAFRPAWSVDGKQVGYILGSSVGIWGAPANAAAGSGPGRALAGTDKSGADSFDWGPAGAPGGALLHTGLRMSRDNSVYQVAEDGTGRSRLVSFESEFEHMLGVRWLPDGSGFLYARTDNMMDSGNIYRYDFASRSTTKVTDLAKGFIRDFSVSPDGKWVVCERAKDEYDSPFSPEVKPELWIMRVDGTAQRLLVRNGKAPSWGRG